jgi:hypothetical protein
MQSSLMQRSLLAGQTLPGRQQCQRCQAVRHVTRAKAAAAAASNSDLGFKTMRAGIKEASSESLLTPRFYTTDFDEMEQLFSLDMNPTLDMEELEAMLRCGADTHTSHLYLGLAG